MDGIGCLGAASTSGDRPSTSPSHSSLPSCSSSTSSSSSATSSPPPTTITTASSTSSLPSSSASSPIFESAIVLESSSTRTVLQENKQPLIGAAAAAAAAAAYDEERDSASASSSSGCPSFIVSTLRRCFPRRNERSAGSRKGHRRDRRGRSSSRGAAGAAGTRTNECGVVVVGSGGARPNGAASGGGVRGACARLLAVMGSAASSSSSPEPDDNCSLAEKVMVVLMQKPLRMTGMLRVARMIGEASTEDRSLLFESGVVNALSELIAEIGSTEHPNRAENSDRRRVRQSRRNSAATNGVHRGVGYGHGSTRSRWDIERTVEERLAREEHLIWLLAALTAYIVGKDTDMESGRISGGIEHATIASEEIGHSAVIPLLEYHLKNDSVFDVSEHMELYQALLEFAAAMSLVPSMVPYLVTPYAEGAKSIAKSLIPKFREVMSAYPNLLKGQMGSPDFRMIDFIHKIERYSEIVVKAAERYEADLPPEQQVQLRTASAASKPRSTQSESALSRRSLPDAALIDSPADVTLLYAKALKHLQMQTFRFIGDYGKLAVPFSFKKEARNLNPFSPAMRDRTKRIAKELASMPNALPLNASNGIFVCVDEGRCDIIKVLISGPDDTPYQNGLFEFDVFFPNNYPLSAPKCAFLTTGAGNVRFNPNLYNDGKICLSILGTWEGRPEEKWNPYCSLLQVLISIQGLIFVKEPYFNEPGFEKYQGTDKGEEYSRKYNLQIMHATLTYAIRDQMRSGPECFRKVIQRHFWLKRHAIIEQARKWLAEMKKDALESEKNNKRKESVSFDTIYTPFAQERTIQQLIQELQNMQCPVDQYDV